MGVLFLLSIYTTLFFASIKRPGIAISFLLFYQNAHAIILSDLNIEFLRHTITYILIVFIFISNVSKREIYAKIKHFTTNPLTWGIIFIIFSMFIGVILRINPEATNVLNSFIIPSTFLFITTSFIFKDEKMLKDLASGLLFYGLFSFLVFYNYFDLRLVLDQGREVTREATGDVFNSIILSRISGIILIASWFNYIFNKKHIIKALSIVAFFISSYFILSIGTRGPFIAVVFALFIYYFYTLESITKKTVVTCTFLIVTIILFSQDFFLFERFKEFEDLRAAGYTTAAGARYQYALHILSIFPENLPLGLGPKGYQYHFYTYPHNLFLELLIDYGIFGVIIMLLIIPRSMNICYKALRDNQLSSYIKIGVILWIYYFINTMFSGNITINSPFWMLTGLLITTEFVSKKKM